VHTDLGHRCRGAKVNGQIVPLYTALENGQRVEILSTKEGGPSLDWLHQGYVKSHRAASKIRHWIRQQHQDIALEAGRSIYDKEAARCAARDANQDNIAVKLGCKHIEELYAALGQGEISQRELNQAFRESLAPIEPIAEQPNDFIKAARANGNGEGILIEGVDKLMTLLAKCCKPVPPDHVMGFVTKGRGISIHRSDCSTLKRLATAAPERLINADWGIQQGHVFATDFLVEAHNRSTLLRDLSDIMSRERINVTAVNTQSKDQRVMMRFTLEIRDAEQLQRILIKLQDVNEVIRVIRG
jgi:GTP pyrophosphokinase